MNRSSSLSPARRRVAGAFLITVAALVVAASPAHSATKPTPTVRIATKAFTKTVAPLQGGGITLPDGQSLSIMCRSGEWAIGQGILSSTHYLTSQSFGPAAGGGYVVGLAGTAKVRLQLLCGKNVKTRMIRREARLIQDGTQGSGFGWAQRTVACPTGFVASGMQTTLDYAPGFGSYSSLPTTPRIWSVRVNRVPNEILQASWAEAAWADVVCVKATGASLVTKKTTIDATGVATTAAVCPAGRRALGWGMSLDTYTTYAPGAAWPTPYVSRAQFAANGRRMDFTFRLPAGATPSSASAIEVRVVCGSPKA